MPDFYMPLFFMEVDCLHQGEGVNMGNRETPPPPFYTYGHSRPQAGFGVHMHRMIMLLCAVVREASLRLLTRTGVEHKERKV